MATMTCAKLKDGFIYGDIANGEYVYMPAGEIGLGKPICVYESPSGKCDVDIDEAERLITVRSLKPVVHPSMGARSC